jgi:hypothetical protein
VDGTAAGGGSFTSATVHTDSQGGFQLTTLPPMTGANLEVVAVPPAGVVAGTARVSLTNTQNPLTLACPRRLQVTGRLLRPDGPPALAASVTAEPVMGPTPADALPLGGDTTTDINGQFSLFLEPGQYRLDFQPSDLPRMSRFLVLTDVFSAQLADLTLSHGKRVTGIVTITNDLEVVPAVLSLVRFFRVDDSTAVLLGETYTDNAGRYSILLPTR